MTWIQKIIRCKRITTSNYLYKQELLLVRRWHWNWHIDRMRMLCVFTFWFSCCDLRYDFHITMMFSSSLVPDRCSMAHALFTLFVFVCALWYPPHTMLCFCFVCPCLVYYMMPVSQCLCIVHFWLPLRYWLTFI